MFCFRCSSWKLERNYHKLKQTNPNQCRYCSKPENNDNGTQHPLAGAAIQNPYRPGAELSTRGQALGGGSKGNKHNNRRHLYI